MGRLDLPDPPRDEDADPEVEAWTQCDDYYNCGGCCSAGEELLEWDS